MATLTRPSLIKHVSEVLGEHVAEQGPLLDCVFKDIVHVREFVELALRHGVLGGLVVSGLEPRHRVGLTCRAPSVRRGCGL